MKKGRMHRWDQVVTAALTSDGQTAQMQTETDEISVAPAHTLPIQEVTRHEAA